MSALSSCIIQSGMRALVLKTRINEDWFDDNNAILVQVLNIHRKLLRLQDHNRRKDTSLLVKLKQSGSELRKLAREIKNNW